jgi:hypothetical protein
MSKTLILDTEVYRNFFYLGIKRVEDGRRIGFEFSERTDFNREHVRTILRRNLSVGFNSRNFDLAIIYLALSGASNAKIKEVSDRIIIGGLKYWELERKLDLYIPAINHIDLFDTNPAVGRGLKFINASMHHKRLQELPFDPAKELTFEEMDRTIEYCQFGDIDGTELLFKTLEEPIQLREAMGKVYGGMDLRSKSDAQMGEAIAKQQVEAMTGMRVRKSEAETGTSFRYKVPEWMKFRTPYMQQVLEEIANTDFYIKHNGKVDFPNSFKKFNIVFDGMKYTLGIGGLHSTENNRAVFSDDDYVLIDADVASQYPSIILKLGLFPKALGETFQIVYRALMETRLAAKRAKDKATDKGLKIAINGIYGKLGSIFSALFGPHLMVSTTLTGQLSLLMLIEAAHLDGIPVVSGNTDGVVFRCPREKWNGFVMKDDKPTDRLKPSPLQDIIEWWEGVTSFNLEFAEYKAIFNESVNTYIALKADGGFKRKGDLANHWRKTTPWGEPNTDYDPAREGLKKSPQMTICSDAVLGYLLKGIPIEHTIFGCRDVREFVRVTQAKGGATWRDEYLGKVVRYYWAKDGEPILRKDANEHGTHAKVPKSDGCRPIMDFADDFALPTDLDHTRYVEEAYQILHDIGGEQYLRSTPILEDLISAVCKINKQLKKKRKRAK